MTIQKPFLKWVGGKTQIIENIIPKFPEKINNYHELFLGGGSVLFALLSLQKDNKIIIKKKIYAYDINEILINLYKHIQNNKDNLYYYINYYYNNYNNILQHSAVNRHVLTIDEAITSKESYYYWIRKKFNTYTDKNNIECVAIFLFLNKTCFRGIYREGPNGFNVPFGNYKNINIISKNEFDNISELIKDVVFIQSNFIDSIKKIKNGDFVYLDPPYAPENNKSFVGYTSDGFDLNTHKVLFNEIINFDKKNIKFLMSNAKVDLVINTFNNFNNIKSEEIIAKRTINSKKPNSKTVEVIIYN